MRALPTLLVAAAAAVAVSIAVSIAPLTPAATASPTSTASGHLQTTRDVLYAGCHFHAYRYVVDVPTDSWYLAVTVRDPAGRIITTDHPYEGTSGTSRVQLCDFDRPGRYRMTARGEWYETPNDGTVHRFPVRAITFVVRRPHTRASVTVAHGRIVAVARGETPSSYRPLGGARITLQRRADGRWHRVASALADTRGRATFRTSSSGGQHYRVRVTARYHTASRSSVVAVSTS